jgi:olefin beta-lactone synthetase
MNIIEILRERAASHPDSAAITEARKGRSRSLTFAELEDSSARVAALLGESGLRAGDAALVFYPMSAELYVVLLAVFRLGLVATFLDPSAGREHIDRCCALYPPQALIASPKAHLLRLVSPALRRIPRKFVIGFPVPGAISLRRAKLLPPFSQIATAGADAPALVTFTSGSTGQPKAALRTHGFLLAQHAVLHHSLTLTEGESDLTTLPIFVLANLASGVTSIIPDADLRAPGAVDPTPVVAQIKQAQPVSTAASPAFLDRLAEHCLARDEQLPSFRKIFTGGAPVFPRLLDKVRQVAPHAKVVAVYGSTEAEPIAEIACDKMTGEDNRKMRGGGGLLAGVPVPEIEARVMRDRWGAPVGPFTAEGFESLCVPAGEAGEIVVRGGHVLGGYLHGKGDEETKFRVDGGVWHRTGDAGYFDAAGRLWLLGRCAARVSDAHGTVYPFAVECAAHFIDGLRRTAFVSHGGRRLLVVEPMEGKTPDAESIRRELAWAKIDEVRVVGRIPVDKRHNAKIDYTALVRMLGSQARV